MAAAAVYGLSPMPTVHAQSAASGDTARAIFAGGCFWCVESDFDKVPGVVSTTSGYTGGHLDNPTYRDVVTETTGHREAVLVEYDPDKVSYEALLDAYWHSVDPTDAEGQFCDRGESYTTAIYTTSDDQQKQAEASAKTISAELDAPVATLIAPAQKFYPAEDYHQDYYRKNPVRYKYYRFGCRRDARLDRLWGDDAHRGLSNTH
ncbi:peptide-methionine (S)-S-oxide reductase MsrA [Hoeflea sp. WL0058]|uniref:Peptide methionine sulfoxide reductase MsrA n=2 Tax=Flavimaribacter sediminis TaxID=2865987 RepID=A0AAE3D0K4_9HYPH|nr:peptide-methionine (S)-S-oxide reductase MsrA [Flavimaribacter sediminis]